MVILNKPEGYCSKCGATFKFDSRDVKYTDDNHTPYLECPGCGSMLHLFKTEWSVWKIILIVIGLIIVGFYIGTIIYE